jgi:hypothetical protein
MSLYTRLFLAPLAIVFIALVASWPAFAQTEAERKACEADAQLHCPDEMPDRAKVQACLTRKVKFAVASVQAAHRECGQAASPGPRPLMNHDRYEARQWDISA